MIHVGLRIVELLLEISGSVCRLVSGGNFYCWAMAV